jgi:predicted transposase/invertase (TIGR01784 family)
MEQSKKSERVLISFDYAIKLLLLRNKIDFEILEGFLSEVLIRDVRVRNIGESESNKENADDKSNKVDILVEDTSGEIILIELQFRKELDYLQRMLFGTSKIVTEHMMQGMDYREIKKVYSINIMYFDLGKGTDYVYHGKTNFTGIHNNEELRLWEEQQNEFKKDYASDIYPEYYILMIKRFGDITKNTLDEWIYFLKNNAIKEEFKAKGLKKAYEVLDRSNFTSKELRAYERILDQRSSELSAIATSKREGRTEGIKEGLEKGEKERKKLEIELEIERAEREKREKELEKERTEREKREKELEKERIEREKERESLLAEIAKLKQK